MPMAGKFLLHVKKTAYNPAGQTVPFRIPKHKRPIDEKQEKPGEEEKPDIDFYAEDLSDSEDDYHIEVTDDD